MTGPALPDPRDPHDPHDAPTAGGVDYTQPPERFLAGDSVAFEVAVEPGVPAGDGGGDTGPGADGDGD